MNDRELVNVKIIAATAFPGDLGGTPQQVEEQIHRALRQIAAGDFDEVEIFD